MIDFHVKESKILTESDRLEEIVGESCVPLFPLLITPDKIEMTNQQFIRIQGCSTPLIDFNSCILFKASAIVQLFESLQTLYH